MGHDLRSGYCMLSGRVTLLRPAPAIAPTARMTFLVQSDICVQLAIPQARRLIHGFRRENIPIELAEMNPSAPVAS